MAGETGEGVAASFDQVDELARWLFNLRDPSGIWAAEDEATRLHFRRQAQQRLAAERYTKTADPL